MRLTEGTCVVNQLVWKTVLCRDTGRATLHKGIVLRCCVDKLKKVLPLQHPPHYGVDFQGRELEAVLNWFGTSASAIANVRARINDIAERANNNLDDLKEP
jgi:hypothetical protein